MKVTESLRISWRAITGHKLRSSLTTLGIVIGIGAVIVFMVLGGAFEANIVNDIKDDDSDPGMWVNTQSSSGGFQFVQAPIYTESDVAELETIDGVDYVSPQATLPVVQLRYDGRQQTGGFTALATSEDLLDESDMVEGDPFESDDEAVITNQTAAFFDDDLGVGDEFQLSLEDGTTKTFTVAGISDGDAGGGNTQPATVYLPLSQYQTTVETPDGGVEQAYSSLIIAADDTDAVDSVKADAIAYFESGESDAEQLKRDDHDIKVQTIDDAIDQISDVIDQLTVFIVGIAAISLLVGSIGIANIMIVSVTERTREIGIMKAIGARKRDVVQLFLVESVILGTIGAAFGVLFGLGFGFLGVSLFGWPMVYPINWILLAVGVGMMVGILSGFYPAWRAARVDPIEALRHE
jgi:putative ABC transport system permease protein